MIALTTAITQVGTADSRLKRELRNWLLRIGSRVPLARNKLADEIEELTVRYPKSPVVVGGRRGPVVAGDAAPDVAEVGLWSRLSPDGAGTDGKHTVLVVPRTDGTVPALAIPSEVRVLVVDGATGAAGGRPEVVDDPQRKVAARYGLGRDGGIVVIRPDGYVGLVSGLDDGGAVRGYLSRLAA